MNVVIAGLDIRRSMMKIQLFDQLKYLLLKIT